MKYLKRHIACIRCSSSDGVSIYDNGDEPPTAHCFVSGCKTIYKPGDDDYYDLHPIMREWEEGQDYKVEEKKSLTDLSYYQQFTTEAADPARNIQAATHNFFRVRAKFDSSAGLISHKFYPVTQNKKLVGYKERVVDGKKFFHHWGQQADLNKCDLFGQFRFPAGSSKFLILTGGEEDAMAMWEALKMDTVARNKKSDIAVVSSSGSESNLLAQVKHHYEYINSFDTIILMLDMDDAGKKATEDIKAVLNKWKVKVASLPMNDVSDMKKAKREADLVNCFWKAETPTIGGIVGSSSLSEAIRQRATMEKIGLPPFAHRLEKMMYGGIPLGVVLSLLAASSVGKSTVVNEFVQYWAFNLPYKIGVAALESDLGEYGENLLSTHLRRKLALITDIDEKLEYLNSPAVLEKERELFFDEYGADRFLLVDHEGSMNGQLMKDKMEYMVKAQDCKLLILDPLTLALSGMNNEQTDEWMAWEQNFCKREMVTCANVLHARKNDSGRKANSTGAELHEEDAKGTGSLFQIPRCNINITRDKESDDPIVRNTSVVKMTKCTWSGETGKAGKYYYSNEEHKLYDLDDWMAKNGIPATSSTTTSQAMADDKPF